MDPRPNVRTSRTERPKTTRPQTRHITITQDNAGRFIVTAGVTYGKPNPAVTYTQAPKLDLDDVLAMVRHWF